MVRVHGVQRAEVEGGIEWTARVAFGDQERTLAFGGPAEVVAGADASMFLAATLLPAMAWAEDLYVEGSVSPLLRRRIDRIARLYRAMDPTLRIPDIHVDRLEERPAGAGIAAMFSRGIDSTFSAAVPRQDPGPLDALVYCRSLEPVHAPETSAEELRLAHVVAERIGLPLQVVWTDLRSFTDPMLGWSTVHGSGLAALAHLVAPAHREVVIATAYDITSISPCGSHPGIDPLFGSEAVAIYHDDLEHSRQDKLDWLVAERPDLVALLKTCYSDDRTDNCGRCHKCLLTMSGLRAAGGLHLATSFPAELDLDAVRSQRVAGLGLRQLWLPIAVRAHERGDRELAEAVGDLLHLSAVPKLRELLRGRSRLLDRLLCTPGPGGPPRYDPEVATTFERFDRVHTTSLLALVRHGEVVVPGQELPQHRVRASTLAGSIASSLAHRRRR